MSSTKLWTLGNVPLLILGRYTTVGSTLGELVSKGPLVAASYPRQTLDPRKVSTVDTGYTTVVPAVAAHTICTSNGD